MNDFNRETLVGVFLAHEWERAGFDFGQIVEVGYHGEQGNLSEEPTLHLWCQTWGTWNPYTADWLNEDSNIKILGPHLDWRSPQYTGLSQEILDAAEKAIEKKHQERDAIALNQDIIRPIHPS